jgi:heat shock protein HspQ
MSRNRTVKDKGRRPLTRAARPARNPGMSDKRRSSVSGADKETKSKAAKPTDKPAAGPEPSDQRTAANPAGGPASKAAGKVRARLKSKPAAKSLPDKSSESAVVAKAKKKPAAAASPMTRPRLRRAEAPKRAIRKRSSVSSARFAVGDVVRHKFYPFRGVVFDIDPVFANTDEWWLSIPVQMRPKKNQPFYHLLAENAETEYIAYVSEQNLLPDTTGVPVRHPQIQDYFVEEEDGRYRPVFMAMLN